MQRRSQPTIKLKILYRALAVLIFALLIGSNTTTAVAEALPPGLLAAVEAALGPDAAAALAAPALLPAQEAKLTASDTAADDKFGRSVAVSGDTAVVGALLDDDGGSESGSAYVFTRSGSVWSQQAKLTASNAAADDEFGTSVAMSGDTIVVGAPGFNSSRGMAYVFVMPGGGWVDATEDARLAANDPDDDDEFGFSVAVSGDTAVIGAPGHNKSRGAAYIFVMPGGGWVNATQDARLTASDKAKEDEFGYSVAVSGDTAVIGAYGDDSKRGSAYVFVMPGGGWVNATQDAKLTASDAAAGDRFGRSVAVDGGTAVVGAYYDDDAGSKSGSAYVFTGSGSVWSQQAKLTASDAAQSDRFGRSVAVSGDTVVIGATDDDNVGSNSGSAYVFVMPGGGWANTNEDAKLTASDAASGDQFGRWVAVDGDTVVVGAYTDDNPGNNSGSAYVFVDAALVVVVNVEDGGDGILTSGETIIGDLNQFMVVFNQDVLGADDPTNYLLYEIGSNGVFDTLDCASGVLADDINISVGSPTYDPTTYTASVIVNGGQPVPIGRYRLHVCGTTSVTSLGGVDLAGDGVTIGTDHILSLRLGTGPRASAAETLPDTGFAPNTITALKAQPAALAYTSTDIVLSIPRLNVSQSIVGVPQSADGWDISWIGNGIGYLAGTSFPTWAGNTALTGHIWNADGSPGIFANLNQLQYGDQFTIEAWGLTYTYEVRDSLQVYAHNLSVLEHSDYDIVTLLTCEGYSEYSGEYRYRRAVTAVLVAITE